LPRLPPNVEKLARRATSDLDAAKAQELLERGCIVGVQGLNVFTTIARRRLALTWGEVREALAAIRTPLSNNASRRQSPCAGKIDFSERPSSERCRRPARSSAGWPICVGASGGRSATTTIA
jgi:hypothetical protein